MAKFAPEIAALRELLDGGIISEAEYDRRRAEVLRDGEFIAPKRTAPIASAIVVKTRVELQAEKDAAVKAAHANRRAVALAPGGQIRPPTGVRTAPLTATIAKPAPDLTDPVEVALAALRVDLAEGRISLIAARDRMLEIRRTAKPQPSKGGCNSYVATASGNHVAGVALTKVVVDHARMARGDTLDRFEHAEHKVTFRVFRGNGMRTVMGGTSGEGALREACRVLRNGSEFVRAELDSGVCLTLNESEGAVSRHWFESAEDAHAAAKAAMSEEGYRRTIIMGCPTCKGKKQIQGEPCRACEGRGKRTMVAVHFIDDEGSAVVSTEIRRGDLLTTERAFVAPAAETFHDVRKARRSKPVCKVPPRHDTAGAKGGIIMRKGWYPNHSAPKRA